MSRLRLSVILLFIPFLMADSCVRQSFVLHEYALDRCPSPDFELPQNVSFAGWAFSALEAEPYCHGFTRYELRELREAEAFGEPVKEAVIYARLMQGKPCRLEVVTNLACNPRESVEECEERTRYIGAFRALRGKTAEYTAAVAQRLTAGQSFSVRVPATKENPLGRADELEEWCRKR